jgi:hypothetical protein
MVGDFNALTGITAAGTPTFTLGLTLTDSFEFYLISGSAQTVTPQATVSAGNTRWVFLATAFKDAAAGGVFPPKIGLWGRDNGVVYSRPGRQ